MNETLYPTRIPSRKRHVLSPLESTPDPPSLTYSLPQKASTRKPRDYDATNVRNPARPKPCYTREPSQHDRIASWLGFGCIRGPVGGRLEIRPTKKHYPLAFDGIGRSVETTPVVDVQGKNAFPAVRVMDDSHWILHIRSVIPAMTQAAIPS